MNVENDKKCVYHTTIPHPYYQTRCAVSDTTRQRRRLHSSIYPRQSIRQNAYLAKHTKLLNASSINQHTIWLSDTIVGSISRFIMEEQAEITYWIDKRFWGRCIATQALQIFLLLDRRDLSSAVQHMIIQARKSIREMWAHTNRLNINYANARHAEIEELIYKLA